MMQHDALFEQAVQAIRSGFTPRACEQSTLHSLKGLAKQVGVSFDLMQALLDRWGIRRGPRGGALEPVQKSGLTAELVAELKKELKSGVSV